MSDIKRALDNKQSRPTRALAEPKFPIVDRRRSERRRFVSSAASNARRSACIVAQLAIMSPIDRADEIEFKRAPPALQFMLGALMPSPGPTSELPPIAATWREHRIDRRSLTTYLALSGSNPARFLPLLYPQIVGFRLNMVVLTHPRFPLPIWKALQARNRIVQHAELPGDSVYVFRTEATAQRVYENAVEIDLVTTARADGVLVWEALNTFHYRGRYGISVTHQPAPKPPSAPAASAVVAEWRSRPDVGWTMAHLTGDYNGIHLFDCYARRFGYRRAFHHPQLIVAQCLTRLAPAEDWPRKLELWLRGPIPYGAALHLCAERGATGVVFSLHVDADRRPAIIGRLRCGHEEAPH